MGFEARSAVADIVPGRLFGHEFMEPVPNDGIVIEAIGCYRKAFGFGIDLAERGTALAAEAPDITMG